ncbi:MAG: cobyrinic acid a,c-diamide synthase [Cyanobacteria bacterium]|nr:cobyrinic acid a,c-diamide synthase [Cyanobacteriota bacterium]MEB3269108.1 cobyrinic acid a,c-diamide synthase [Leptolyngbya sp.]
MVFVQPDHDPIFGSLPWAAKQWLESLPWEQRRYVLSLCHLLSASNPETQAEFLDDYTADGLVLRVIQDQDTRQKVSSYLRQFHIDTELTQALLRSYIRQFYIHSAQDARQQPDLYLESALRLMISTQERSSVFSYVLGFELIKLIFTMSWSQQERLYRLQISQEEFIRTYIRPIQHTHRINGIIVPKDEGQFFARRDYYVQKPDLQGKRLVELVMATFTAEVVGNLGFGIIRTPNAFQFDYDYIYASEPGEAIFD